MSADAKLWTETDGRDWRGLHDGPCACDVPHDQGGALLSELIYDIERCMKATMRWELTTYGNGLGLRGFVA